MNYLSVCSGVEAATQAWHPLGWTPWAFAEIEKFPSAVLKHHYPKVPNLGDMTKFKEWPDAILDVLVGGTPCQSYSVAGLRKGLDDPRGDLMLTYVAIARRYRPSWVVWENVPGVLSDDEGRSFGTLLGLLTGQIIEVPAGGWKSAGFIEGYKSAYGIAWRIVDTQFARVDSHPRAVPQRRRRLFVVGYLGDWRRAAAVLLERESLSGNPPPRREAGKGTAARAEVGPGSGCPDVAKAVRTPSGGIDREDMHTIIPVVSTMSESSGHARPGDNIQSVDYLIPVAGTLDAAGGKSRGAGTPSGMLVPEVSDPIIVKEGETYTHEGTNFRARNLITQAVANPLTARMHKGVNTTMDEGQTMVAMAIQERAISENPDAGPDGVGVRSDGAAYTLEARQTPQAVAFSFKAPHFTRDKDGAPSDVYPPLSADADKGDQDPLVCAPVAFDTTQITHPDNRSNPQPDGPCHPLASGAHAPAVAFQPRFARNGRGAPDVVASALTGEAGRTGKGDSAQCVAFQSSQSGVRVDDVHATLDSNNGSRRHNGVVAGWRVRRLTPTECERLQAFREIENQCIIQVCFAPQKTDAPAGKKSRKSRLSVSTAEEGASVPPALTVEAGSCASHLAPESPVVVDVRINLERGEVLLKTAEKSLTFAKGAASHPVFPLPEGVEDFAQLGALLLAAQGLSVTSGREGLPLSTQPSSPAENGRVFVVSSGPEIEQRASDVESAIAIVNRCSTSTTSGRGHSSENWASILETLSCCVVHAIGLCIPRPTSEGSSFAVRVTTVNGYTNVPWRGAGGSPDGPRYKSLGNSMSCNVMSWLGQRIQMVSDLDVHQQLTGAGEML